MTNTRYNQNSQISKMQECDECGEIRKTTISTEEATCGARLCAACERKLVAA